MESQRGPTQIILGAFDLASRFLENIVAQVEELWEIDSSKLKLNHGQKAPVMDILIWAECYKCTGMAAILSCSFPQKPRELFAYMQIIHATRKYLGPSWVTCTYDHMFRRLTTARCSLTGIRSTSWTKRKHCLSVLYRSPDKSNGALASPILQPHPTAPLPARSSEVFLAM